MYTLGQLSVETPVECYASCKAREASGVMDRLTCEQLCHYEPPEFMLGKIGLGAVGLLLLFALARGFAG